MSSRPIIPPDIQADAEARWLRYQVRTERAMREGARRRQEMLLALLALLLVALGGRLAYWQVGQHALLATWADAEHLRQVVLPAGRGMILDANGVILAVSVTEDAVIADPTVIRAAGAQRSDSAALARDTGLPAALIAAQLNVPGEYVQVRAADGTPVLLTQAQSDTIAAAIQAGTLLGVALYPQVQRTYPSGGLAAQVLGFVRGSDAVGQYGVEQAENAALAGQPGQLYTAVNAAGQPIVGGIQRQTPAVPGANVTLTLDANVQYWVEQGLAQTVAQMQADGGTALVLDPATGAIIAMASVPSFNPNSYGLAPLADLTNPAVSAVYDPGSVMKAVTMAAGVQQGVITPNTSFYDTGATMVDGITLYNFDRQGHGEETMTQVLQYSANVGAVWVEQRLGENTFERFVRAFGFGTATGVDLPNEAAGLMPQATSAGDGELNAAENAFGESIGVTALQMATAYAALANGGLLLQPYIVASVAADGGAGAVTRFGPHVVRRVVSAATARTVTQMLVNSARVSEAEMWRISGYTVAAKTGTSTPDPANPGWTYASVVGYAPASQPRFVLLVTLDHPRATIYGGSAAGPLWRSLAERLLAYYHCPPDAG